MAQKTKPTNFRIGLSKLWQVNYQSYGRIKNNNFIILNKYFSVIEYLFNFFFNKQLILNSIKIWISNSNIFISVILDKKTINLKETNWLINNSLLKSISYWFLKLNPNNIRYYLNYKEVYFSNYFFFYIEYLVKKFNLEPSKLLPFLFYLFTKKLNSIKIVLTRFGLLCCKLKGFKISLKGRFENLKNPMAKHKKYKLGNISLTTINNEIIFFQKPIFTKLGIFNLKIWLFYQIIEN